MGERRVSTTITSKFLLLQCQPIYCTSHHKFLFPMTYFQKYYWIYYWNQYLIICCTVIELFYILYVILCCNFNYSLDFMNYYKYYKCITYIYEISISLLQREDWFVWIEVQENPHGLCRKETDLRWGRGWFFYLSYCQSN